MSSVILDCGEYGKVEVLIEEGEELKEKKGRIQKKSATKAAKKLNLEFEKIKGVVNTLTSSIKDMIENLPDKAMPDKASVEFGIDVGAETGEITALLAGGKYSGKAMFKISFEWNKKDLYVIK